MRRLVGAGLLRRGRNTGGSAVIPQPPDIIAPAGDLVEWWAARTGISLTGSDVTTWTGQKAAIVLNAINGGPTYGADGANFGGANVVQCVAASAKALNTGTLGADIYNVADHAYAILGLRYRTALLAASPTWNFSLRPSDGGGSSLMLIQPGSANGTLKHDGINAGTSGDVACDTAVHAVEVWLDAATGDMLSVDGTDSTGSGGTATPGANKSLTIGSYDGGAFASDVSISGIVLCRSLPSAAERAALRTWLFQRGGAL